MDRFPRLQLFTPREVRAAAIFALAATALLVLAIAYVRPVATSSSPAAAPPTPRPSPMLAYVTPISGSEAFLLVIDSGSRGARTILHTANGGRTWQRLKLPANFVAQLITPLARQRDLALSGVDPSVGDDPSRGLKYWITHDGGTHWAPVATPAGESVQFVPESAHAFSQRIGPEGFTLRTSDDEGATWRTAVAAAGSEPRVAGVSVRAPVAVGYTGQTLWLMVGEIGQSPEAQSPPHLLRSIDDGGSWEEVTLPPMPPQYSAQGSRTFSMPVLTSGGRGYMWMIRDSVGKVQGWFEDALSLGYVTTTDDGGATWSPVLSAGHFPVFRLPGDTSWWATDHQDLFESADFGASWSTIHPILPPGLQLMHIARATPHVAWSVYSSGGRVYVLKTTDGGRHWAEVALPAP